jgi:hypothetical protein
VRLVLLGVPPPCRTTDATCGNVWWWEHVVHGAAYGSSMGYQTGGVELGIHEPLLVNRLAKPKGLGVMGVIHPS